MNEQLKSVFDTLYLLRVDTASNTEIYYHDTIKLIENNNWWSINAPILISLIALFFTIGYSFYQLRKERIEKDLERKERKLMKKPLLNLDFDMRSDNLFFDITNQGLGPAIITELYYEYNNERINDFIELTVVLTNNETDKYFEDKSSSKGNIKENYINVGTSFEIFRIFFKKDSPINLFTDELSKVKCIINYENIFGDKFQDIQKLNIFEQGYNSTNERILKIESEKGKN